MKKIMKKFILMLSSVLISTFATHASETHVEFSKDAYEKILVDMEARVYIIESNEDTLKIDVLSSDSLIDSSIKFKENPSKGTLKITGETTRKNVIVFVRVPQESGLKVEPSRSFEFTTKK